MDGGLPRAPQPSDRRAVTQRVDTRQEAAYRPQEEPRYTPEEPKLPRRVSEPRSTAARHKKEPNRFWLIASIVVGVLLVGFIAWSLLFGNKTNGAGIDGGKYQAVYLMNGQIYFGKLTALGNDHLKLTKVYYLQTPAATTGESNTQANANNPQLIKLSNAIYGPSDEMVISKDQVLYFQNLDSKGKATQLIENDN